MYPSAASGGASRLFRPPCPVWILSFVGGPSMLGAPWSWSVRGPGRDPGPSGRRLPPRRPQASPLFRLVQDHLPRLQTVYDERFASVYGEWRPVVGEVADKVFAYGILEHGFARVAARTVTAAIPHAHRQARPRRRYRRRSADPWLPRQLASASALARHGWRVPPGWHLRVVAPA